MCSPSVCVHCLWTLEIFCQCVCPLSEDPGGVLPVCVCKLSMDPGGVLTVCVATVYGPWRCSTSVYVHCLRTQDLFSQCVYLLSIDPGGVPPVCVSTV